MSAVTAGVQGVGEDPDEQGVDSGQKVSPDAHVTAASPSVPPRDPGPLSAWPASRRVMIINVPFSSHLTGCSSFLGVPRAGVGPDWWSSDPER